MWRACFRPCKQNEEDPAQRRDPGRRERVWWGPQSWAHGLHCAEAAADASRDVTVCVGRRPDAGRRSISHSPGQRSFLLRRSSTPSMCFSLLLLPPLFLLCSYATLILFSFPFSTRRESFLPPFFFSFILLIFPRFISLFFPFLSFILSIYRRVFFRFFFIFFRVSKLFFLIVARTIGGLHLSRGYFILASFSLSFLPVFPGSFHLTTPPSASLSFSRAYVSFFRVHPLCLFMLVLVMYLPEALPLSVIFLLIASPFPLRALQA